MKVNINIKNIDWLMLFCIFLAYTTLSYSFNLGRLQMFDNNQIHIFTSPYYYILSLLITSIYYFLFIFSGVKSFEVEMKK